MRKHSLYVFYLFPIIALWAHPSFSKEASSQPEQKQSYASAICNQLLSEGQLIASSTSEYINAMYKTRGLSVVLKPIGPFEPNPYSLFFKQPDPGRSRLRRVLQFLPEHLSNLILGQKLELKPLIGVMNEILVRTPIKWGTKKILGAEHQLSHVVMIPLSFYLFGLGFHQGVEVPTQNHFEKRMWTEIRKNEAMYRTDVLYDYGYDDIRKEYMRGDSVGNGYDEILFEAYQRATAFEEYYQFIETEAEHDKLFDPEVENQLKNHVLFVHLKKLIDQGFTSEMKEGFEIPPEKIGKHLSQSEQDTLFQIHHRLYLRYNIIHRAFIDGETFDTIPKVRDYILALKNDSFVIQLMNRVKLGKIKIEEVSRLIQKDVYWQAQFEMWNFLGVKRLRYDFSRSQFTEQRLTLEDIRAEVLSGIDKN